MWNWYLAEIMMRERQKDWERERKRQRQIDEAMSGRERKTAQGVVARYSSRALIRLGQQLERWGQRLQPPQEASSPAPEIR